MSATAVTGETEGTQPENRLFYPALDGARAIAFLMVFLVHYFNFPWGWSGVDLFFVLSGFLITGILYDSRNALHRARTFYIRRTLRIFPLYYGVLLLLLLTWPLLHWEWTWKGIVWPLYLGNFADLFPLIPGSAADKMAHFWLSGLWHGHTLQLFFGHFWSLCVEEQFYLVWPWVVFAVHDRRKLMWLCAGSLPLCLAARIVCLHGLSPAFIAQGMLFTFTPLRVDALLSGSLLALLMRGPEKRLVLQVARWLLPIITLAVVLLLTLSAGQRSLWTSIGQIQTFGFSVACAYYTVLVGCLVQPGLLVSRLMCLPPLRWAGRITYGAYVFHDIFHHYIVRVASYIHFAPQVSVVIIGLTFTFTLAWLSFRFFETPFLNLKNRWAPPMAPPATMPSS